MSKKTSLSAALRGIENPEQEGQKPVTTKARSDKTSEQGVQSQAPKSRIGKKIVSGHFDPAVSKQFRTIGLEHDRTGQDLLTEALNDLFVKYGKSPIA